MHIVHVFVEVKSDAVVDFIEATILNAKASLKEPGITRFDVIQETDTPNRFVLIEVYRTKDDPARHKETEHYQHWRETVEDMMAVPRTKKIYDNIFPDDSSWD